MHRPWLLVFCITAGSAVVLPTFARHARADRHKKEAQAHPPALRCDPAKSLDGKCPLNERPIIGILAEEVGENTTATLKLPIGSSFVAASYVKWVESGGARVAPIMINQTRDYYAQMMSRVNGVVFPGGAVSLDVSGYGRAGRIIFDIAKELNANGTYFPLWGTCLGFELLTLLTANRDWLSNCEADNVTLPVKFDPDFRNSKMFGNAPQAIVEMLQRNLTANSHHFCITPEDFARSGLDQQVKNLGTSTDRNGTEFVAVLEDRTNPFYGVQFHPEKSNFEWRHPSAFSHGAEAVLISQYFANFFVSEARQNFQQFPSRNEEDKYVIYNWTPLFSRATVYDQMYIFSL